MNFRKIVIGVSVVAGAAFGNFLYADDGKVIHQTNEVYPAIGPYSQIVQAGNIYFLSGVIPLNLEGTALVSDSIADQTRIVLTYISAKLASVNLSLEDVTMSTVYLNDLNDFAVMNEIYAEFFGENAPARATVEVSRLPRDSKIEIAVIASK